MSPIDDLSDGDADAVALVIRATAGTLGPFGGVIGEVCTSLIPNQRHERIVRYVRAVARELEAHAERFELIEARLRTDEGSDLFAEGVVQAARAVSQERLSRLARVVAKGLTDDEFEYDRTKKLMALVAKLTDSEFIVLRYFSLHPAIGDSERSAMMERHRKLLYPVSGEIGLPEPEANRGAFKTAYEQTLATEGVLDATAKPKRLTRLGNLLLRYTEEVAAADASDES